MNRYKLEVLSAEQIRDLSADLPKEKNKVIVETAGFIPLEVKFKQFEQNGIINQLRTSDFTSSDYRDMYLHEDFDVTPEDDIEEAQEKLNKLQEFRQKLQDEIKQKEQTRIKESLNRTDSLNKAPDQQTEESKQSDSAENKE